MSAPSFAIGVQAATSNLSIRNAERAVLFGVMLISRRRFGTPARMRIGAGCARPFSANGSRCPLASTPFSPITAMWSVSGS